MFIETLLSKDRNLGWRADGRTDKLLYYNLFFLDDMKLFSLYSVTCNWKTSVNICTCSLYECHKVKVVKVVEWRWFGVRYEH